MILIRHTGHGDDADDAAPIATPPAAPCKATVPNGPTVFFGCVRKKEAFFVEDKRRTNNHLRAERDAL